MTVIAVDFDGTIVTENYPGIGEPIEDAINCINILYDQGYCIIINSCRARERQDEMKQWLHDHGVKYCHVNENCRERVVNYRTDCRKISADCYIDDKSIYGIPSWPSMITMIVNKFGYCQVRDCQLKQVTVPEVHCD